MDLRIPERCEHWHLPSVQGRPQSPGARPAGRGNPKAERKGGTPENCVFSPSILKASASHSV